MRFHVITSLVAMMLSSFVSGEVATATIDPAGTTTTGTPPVTTTENNNNDDAADAADVLQESLEKMAEMMKIMEQQQKDMEAMQKIMADSTSNLQPVGGGKNKNKKKERKRKSYSTCSADVTTREEAEENGLKVSRFANFHYPEKRDLHNIKPETVMKMAPWQFYDVDENGEYVEKQGPSSRRSELMGKLNNRFSHLH